MNPLIFLLLAGAAIAVVAATSESKPPVTASTAGLVEDAQSMIDVFTIYSTKMGELSTAELDKLAALNATAKGIPFKTVAQYLGDWSNTPGDKTDEGARLAKQEYKRLYYLPPGVSETTGPDMFTEWAYFDGQSNNMWGLSPDPSIVCEQTFGSGSGPIGAPQTDCYKGYFLDFFGRKVGNFQSDGTVWGQSDLLAIAKGYGKDFRDLWEAAGPDLLKTVADYASNYPGIGTVIASAVTFLSEVGSGASLENASIAAGRAAIPSTLRAAYDVGVGLAIHGELDVDAALSIAMAAAISNGVITGDVLEKYNTIKTAYEDAKAVGEEIDGGLGTLGTAVEIAT